MKQRLFALFTAGMVLVGLLAGIHRGAPHDAAWAGEKKDEKKAGEKRSGTVVGQVTAKGVGFVEVKADGEAKARRYVPRWVGGEPAKGGGFDKKMVQNIRDLRIGSRVRLEWEFEERPRVVVIEVLRAPDGVRGAEEKKIP